MSPRASSQRAHCITLPGRAANKPLHTVRKNLFYHILGTLFVLFVEHVMWVFWDVSQYFYDAFCRSMTSWWSRGLLPNKALLFVHFIYTSWHRVNARILPGGAPNISLRVLEAPGLQNLLDASAALQEERCNRSGCSCKDFLVLSNDNNPHSL